MQETVISLSDEIVFCVGYSVTFISNILGNLCVCAVVLRNRDLQNFTSILLLNMAVGDLIVGVAGIIHIMLEVSSLITSSKVYSLLCGHLNGIILFSASISIYTMALLSFDRYLSIVKPVIRRVKLTRGKLKAIIPLVWITSLAFLGLCFYFIERYNFEEDKLICWETLPHDELPAPYRISLFILMYLLPMCVTMFFFVKIFVHLWWSSECISPATNQVLLRSRQHLTRVLATIVIVFNICWLPWFALELSVSFGFSRKSPVLQSGLALLAVAHSSVNPFIYSFQSRNFRRHLRRLTHKKRPRLSVGEKDNQEKIDPETIKLAKRLQQSKSVLISSYIVS